MADETKVVQSSWDLSTYKWKVEAEGLRLLVKGTKDKKILGRKCHKCGTVYIPGPTYCRKCFIDIDKVVEAKPTGVLGAFTVNLADVRGNPLQEITITGCIKIDGSDSYIMGRLDGWTDWKTVKQGMKVKVVWAQQTTGALSDIYGFAPI